LKKVALTKNVEDLALQLLLVVWPLTSVIVILTASIKGYALLAITGRPSIGFYAICAAPLYAFLLFGYIYYRSRNNEVVALSGYKKVLSSVVLALIYAITVAFISAVFIRLLNESFIGLELDIYTSAALVGAWCGAVAYAITKLASRVTALQLVNILSGFLIGGVLMSMITTQDPDWWLANFSTLGQVDQIRSISVYAFNMTLILSGFVMLVIGQYLVFSIQKTFPKKDQKRELKIGTLRVLFTIISLGLMGVGFFPYKAEPLRELLHNGSAGIMVFGFLILIGLLRWLLPQISKTFLMTSYITAAALVAALVLFFKVGYLSLTAFELSCFAICFSWYYLFLKQASSQTQATI
jgi:MFS family permease